MEKESRLLNIGVVGAGPISQAAHFEACRKARNAELYAICDLAADLVTNMAAIHHPHVTYLDYDEMLADPHAGRGSVHFARREYGELRRAAGYLGGQWSGGF